MKRTVCGLDVHKDSVFCCILCADGRKIQHKFGVLTEALVTLRDLMESEGVEECAMESTGIYMFFHIRSIDWMPFHMPHCDGIVRQTLFFPHKDSLGFGFHRGNLDRIPEITVCMVNKISL